MLASLLVVVHVLAVLWLVAGIVGRNVCFAQAERTDDLAALRTMTGMGGLFERAFIRAATLIVLLTGLIAAWARGWPILGFLTGSPINWVLAALLVYLSIIPVIVFIFLPKGRVFQKVLAEASTDGTVTPALRRAMADPLVRAAHAYELLMIAVLVWLMIAKPF